MEARLVSFAVVNLVCTLSYMAGLA